MRETTRVAAVRTALDPIATKPLAAEILADIDRYGRVTDASLEPVLDNEHVKYSTGEKILLELVLVICDYGVEYTRTAHPAMALHTLSGTWLTAYVGALAIVATGGADLDGALVQAVSR